MRDYVGKKEGEVLRTTSTSSTVPERSKSNQLKTSRTPRSRSSAKSIDRDESFLFAPVARHLLFGLDAIKPAKAALDQLSGFLGEVQKRARPAKAHFWAKFEDGEYKCNKLSETPLAPSQKNGYGNTWLLVKAK